MRLGLPPAASPLRKLFNKPDPTKWSEPFMIVDVENDSGMPTSSNIEGPPILRSSASRLYQVNMQTGQLRGIGKPLYQEFSASPDLIYKSWQSVHGLAPNRGVPIGSAKYESWEEKFNKQLAAAKGRVLGHNVSTDLGKLVQSGVIKPNQVKSTFDTLKAVKGIYGPSPWKGAYSLSELATRQGPVLVPGKEKGKNQLTPGFGNLKTLNILSRLKSKGGQGAHNAAIDAFLFQRQVAEGLFAADPNAWKQFTSQEGWNQDNYLQDKDYILTEEEKAALEKQRGKKLGLQGQAPPIPKEKKDEIAEFAAKETQNAVVDIDKDADNRMISMHTINPQEKGEKKTGTREAKRTYANDDQIKSFAATQAQANKRKSAMWDMMQDKAANAAWAKIRGHLQRDDFDSAERYFLDTFYETPVDGKWRVKDPHRVLSSSWAQQAQQQAQRDEERRNREIARERTTEEREQRRYNRTVRRAERMGVDGSQFHGLDEEDTAQRFHEIIMAWRC